MTFFNNLEEMVHFFKILLLPSVYCLLPPQPWSSSAQPFTPAGPSPHQSRRVIDPSWKWICYSVSSTPSRKPRGFFVSDAGLKRHEGCTQGCQVLPTQQMNDCKAIVLEGERKKVHCWHLSYLISSPPLSPFPLER